jgi:HK97 family phage major capsid protein
MNDYIQRQIEERQKAWHSAKEILDLAASEKRDLSAEERQAYDRTMADLDSRAEVIKTMTADEKRAREIEAAAEAAPEVRTEARPVTTDEDRLRSFLQGDQRSITFAPERRDVTKASTGAPVPTSFYNSVMEKFRYTGPMLNPDVVSIWNTTSGENLQVPVQNARPTGTLTAEADPFAESDPTFSAFITLGAYKYGFLTQMSRELIEDNGREHS